MSFAQPRKGCIMSFESSIPILSIFTMPYVSVEGEAHGRRDGSFYVNLNQRVQNGLLGTLKQLVLLINLVGVSFLGLSVDTMLKQIDDLLCLRENVAHISDVRFGI